MRRIIHVDMDAFFASIEQRDDPALRGKPVAVGGRPDRRGVVAAASYEARAFGVRSAMAMARAVRLCPSLMIVPPNFQQYQKDAAAILAIFREVTPLVEPLSIDEAYLDVTENAWNEPFATTIARRLKARIRETTGLSASAGVAPNKFLAKIASGWSKPDGLTVITPDQVEPFLQKLPIEALSGVGPVTARKLRACGIVRIADVPTVPLDRLRQVVGSNAEWLARLALGIDDRPVAPNRAVKSSGSEKTYASDLEDRALIADEVSRMAREGAAWLERHTLFARTVTIKVRYSDFTTITRSDTRMPPTRDAEAIARRAVGLLDRTAAGSRAVRLLGVSLHGLETDDAGRPVSPPESRRLPFPEE
jgi:DNA polymerase IV